jgi:hypothetical protein
MAEDNVSGMEQLQAAALTAIRAGQAFLQAAEHLVANPESAAQLASMVAMLAKAAMSTIVPPAPSPPAPPSSPVTEATGLDDVDPGFERIDVR